MVTNLSELHFWTIQEDVAIKDTDYGSFKYYAKKEGNDSLTKQSKKLYCEQRGLIWTLPNKRPQRLRDKLKEFEDYLIHNKIVSFTWEETELRLLLSTGLLVDLSINHKTGDLANISFDKQLSGRLQVNIICDGVILGNQVICVCNDGHVLGYGSQWKDGWVLEGGPRRKLNCHGEWLAVWGKAGAEHPQPWSPLAKDHQRANLHLYWIGAGDPELLAYKKTDGEPLLVVVSKFRHRTLIVIEQRVTQRGTVSVELSNFELVGSNLKRISVTSVPLQTQISCSALSEQEDRLLICCIDGSLALLDYNRGSTRTIKAAFIPTLAAWQPDGAVVAVTNERGQLQYYDTALNCVRSQFLNEECAPTPIVNLSSYFTADFSIASINWGYKDLVISFEQGPLAILTHANKSMDFLALIRNYLSAGEVDKAIKLLLSREFREDSFFALQKIVGCLLRQPLTEEIAQHLQRALGSYHNSPVPLRSQVRHRYGNQVVSLTRRFFHQLVRAEMFETAFLLAVDVGHHDLFMDLHYVAVKIGETEMAAAARAQASALLSRCSSEASNCSRSSCSQCSDTESTSSEDSEPSSNRKEPQKLLPTNNPHHSLTSDNCLTTDFSRPDPTTYTPTKDKQIIAMTSQSGEHFRPTYAPRATFVKCPQVPINFGRINPATTPNVLPPPLPYSSPLPNLPFLSSNSGFRDGFPSPSRFSSHCDLSNSSFPSPLDNAKIFQNSNTKRCGKVLTPPLPQIPSAQFDLMNFSPANVPDPPFCDSQDGLNGAGAAKKNQAKVKFSDTVTAFIVPEIKRPLRPLPPAHVTNPQRELADSLPLCHPNEDYLKDFAPVRKEDTDESDGGQTAKIKVVHFGVV